jgi:hypothetical protein
MWSVKFSWTSDRLSYTNFYVSVKQAIHMHPKSLVSLRDFPTFAGVSLITKQTTVEGNSSGLF